MNRKILCLLLALVMTLSLLACGKKKAEATEPAATQPASENVGNQETENGETTAPIEPVETQNPGQETDPTTESAGNGSNAGATTAPTIQDTEPDQPEVSMGVEKGDVSPDIDDEETTKSTKPKETKPTETKPKETKPKETEPKETKPENDPGNKKFNLENLTYEEYNALSGEDQKKVIGMFGSTDDFMRWYRAVEAIYKAEHPDIEIGGGDINAGDIGG